MQVHITHKKCNRCRVTKPVTEFSKDRSTSDGYRGQCKPCRSAYRRGRRDVYVREHEERRRERDDEMVVDDVEIVVTKKCTKCKQVKSEDQFGKKSHMKSQKATACLECEKAAQMKVNRKKKLLVQYHLSQSQCQDCGCDDWRLLENDHVNNDKSRNSNGKRYRTISKNTSFKKVIEELGKCEVVCIKCHRIRTHSRFPEKNTVSHTFNDKKAERRAFVDREKIKSGACALCEEKVTESTMYLFDWDHKDPTTKLDNISDLCNELKSLSVIKAEIDKCRLLCCSCHRLHTRMDGQWVDIFKASPLEIEEVKQMFEKYTLSNKK